MSDPRDETWASTDLPLSRNKLAADLLVAMVPALNIALLSEAMSDAAVNRLCNRMSEGAVEMADALIDDLGKEHSDDST